MMLLLLLLLVVVCAGGLLLLLLPLLMIGPIRLSWHRLAIRRGEAWGTSKNEKKKPKLNLHDECCSYYYPRHTTAYYYLVAAGCGRTLVSSFVDRSVVICRSVLLSSARLRVKCKSAKFTVYCVSVLHFKSMHTFVYCLPGVMKLSVFLSRYMVISC